MNPLRYYRVVFVEWNDVVEDVFQYLTQLLVLTSFGFLGVSARPPRTKNWVLVISMLWSCL